MKNLSNFGSYGLIALVIIAIGWLLYQDKQDIKALNKQNVAFKNYLDAEYDVSLVEDRVIHLPEDGSAYYCTIITNSDWQTRQDQREFVAWWETNPRLASLKAQTHFHHYTDADRLYSATLSQQYGTNLPIVVLQENKGRVLYKASGKNIPGNSELLAQSIADNCPRPDPSPGPGPTPNPTPGPKPNIPDIVKPVDDNNGPVSDELGLVGIILAVLAGAGLGVKNQLSQKI